MKQIFILKQRLSNVIKIATPIQGIRGLWDIPLYRNSIYLILSSGILAILGFIFWAVAARLYPVEGVGFASAAISAMALLALLSTLGLDYGLMRFLPSSDRKASEVMNSCFTVSSLASIAVSAIFLAGLHLWSPALLAIREHPTFFASFIVFTVASTLMTFVSRTFVAERRASFTLVQGLVFGLLRFVPLVFLATPFHTFGIFASWGLTMSLAVIICVFLILPRVRAGYRPLPSISKQVINEIIHFSFANYGANLLWAIPSLALPLMVVNRLGAEPNAYFYVGWATASVLFMIPVATSLSLFAEGSHNREGLARDTGRSLKLILIILVPAIILMFVLGDKILLLFGRAYSENAVRLLQILAISALPVGVNHLYFSIKRVEMKMKSVVVLSALIAVFTLALSWSLLPRMGVWGAGVAFLAAQGTVAIVVIPILFRRGRESVLSKVDYQLEK